MSNDPEQEPFASGYFRSDFYRNQHWNLAIRTGVQTIVRSATSGRIVSNSETQGRFSIALRSIIEAHRERSGEGAVHIAIKTITIPRTATTANIIRPWRVVNPEFMVAV